MKLRALIIGSTFRAGSNDLDTRVLVDADASGYAWLLVARDNRRKVALRTDKIVTIGPRPRQWRAKR